MNAKAARQPVLLTIDLEDWYQLVGQDHGFVPRADQSARLAAQVNRIIAILESAQATATFFVLGITAEAHPEVVASVSRAGHEIACHGYRHQPVHSMTRAEFENDIRTASAVLRAITGKRPVGYRAPAFSIDQKSFWAYDTLIDHGFTYDSSVFPFRGRRYGLADFDVDTRQIQAPSGRFLMEFPLATIELAGRRIPVAGGGYWRLLPRTPLLAAIDHIAKYRAPVLYFHPAEFDNKLLSPPSTAPHVWPFAFQQNLGRRRVPSKVEGLLASNRCISVSAYMQEQAPLDSRCAK